MQFSLPTKSKLAAVLWR